MSTTGQIPSKQVKHQKTKSHLPLTINSYLTANSKDEVKLKEVKEVKDDDSGGHQEVQEKKQMQNSVSH